MKILFFTPQLFGDGGVERTLIDKSNYLVSQGHKVMLVTFMQQGRPFYFPLEKSVEHYDTDTCFHKLYRYPFYLRIFKYLSMRKKLKNNLTGILNFFKPDVISISSPQTLSLLYILKSIKSTSKIILESHMAFHSHFLDYTLSEKLLCYIYPPLKTVRKLDLLISLTIKDANCWRAHNVKNIKVIPNPVPFYNEKINIYKFSNRRIISVGRLTSQKRFDRLIDAFSLISEKYPEWYIDIYGSGGEESILNNKIRSLHLNGRVNFCGRTNNIQVEYERSSFFVQSSDSEGFGLVLAEAMACGLPCVSTDCPYGPAEIIENGKTGLLSKMEVQDLADKMEWMITHEKERKEMGFKAHQAAARYKKDVVMKEWEETYMSVLNQ